MSLCLSTFPPKYTKRFTNQKQSCWDHSLYHGFVDGKVSFTQIDAFGFRPLRTHISSYVYVFSRCMMCVRVSAIIDSRLSSVWHFLPTQFSHVSQIRCKWWNDVETMWKSCGIGIFLHLPPILPTAICKNCRIDWIPKLSFQHLAALAALGALGRLSRAQVAGFRLCWKPWLSAALEGNMQKCGDAPTSMTSMKFRKTSEFQN